MVVVVALVAAVVVVVMAVAVAAAYAILLCYLCHSPNKTMYIFIPGTIVGGICVVVVVVIAAVRNPGLRVGITTSISSKKCHLLFLQGRTAMWRLDKTTVPVFCTSGQCCTKISLEKIWNSSK